MGSESEPTLAGATPEQFAEEFKKRMERGEIIDENGFILDPYYELFSKLKPTPCVDGIPVRVNEDTGEIEVGAIVRKGGKYKGRFAEIGGNVVLGESIDTALRRHFRDDLGLEIDYLDHEGRARRPMALTQYKPHEEGEEGSDEFHDDPTKHSIAATFLVVIPEGQKIKTGTGLGKNQEADGGIQWFSQGTLPPPDQFAYGQHDLFVMAFGSADRLLGEEEKKREAEESRASFTGLSIPVSWPK